MRGEFEVTQVEILDEVVVISFAGGSKWRMRKSPGFALVAQGEITTVQQKEES